MNGSNGMRKMNRYGEIMRRYLLCLLLFAASTAFATSVEVHLQRVTFLHSGADLLLVTDATDKIELPDPLFELGESCTNLNQKIAALDKMDIVVATTIEEVIPIAITGLKDLYLDGFSSPLYWYRIKCKVRKVVKGDFPASSLEFVATNRGNQPAWQFVRGFGYYLGLKESEEGWEIKRHFRSSPLPPYKIEDYVNYFYMRSDYPDFDWSQSDAVIKQAAEKVGRRCRDASLVNGTHLIMTFKGDKLWGDLNIDYGQSVTIITNKWKFPLPDNYTPGTKD